MSKKPKISIVMPSYNRAHFLPEAIEGCLNQTFKDFELIIVDDCSKDNSAEVAGSYASKDDRIKVIVNKTNKKLPNTLNIGFKAARGEYFTWSSDDNFYHRDALSEMSKVLDDNKDIGLVYADYTLIDDHSNLGHRIYQEQPEYLPIRDCVGACFLYRADVAKIVGEYNEERFLIEDYEYWLRMGLITKLFHIDKSLYFYRVHEGSLTQERKVEIKAAKNKLKELFAEKYSIPKELKPINELYMWFIGDRNFTAWVKLFKIIISNPISTLSYIIKNLRRIQ